MCNECFQQVKSLTARPPNATVEDIQALTARREKFTNANPFFLTCTKRNDHGVDDFTAVTRFVKPELDKAIKEMEEIQAELSQDSQARETSDAAQEPSQGAEQGAPNGSTSNSEPAPPKPVESAPVVVSTVRNQDIDPVLLPPNPPPAPNDYDDQAEFPDPLTSPIRDNYTPANAPPRTTEIPVDRLQIIPASYYDPPTGDLAGSPFPSFSELWRAGLPLLVKGVLPRFKIRWTPRYFIDRYGEQSCLVVECQTDTNKRVSVREFFEAFGSYEGRKECWKLKVIVFSSTVSSTFVDRGSLCLIGLAPYSRLQEYVPRAL